MLQFKNCVVLYLDLIASDTVTEINDVEAVYFKNISVLSQS